MSPAAESNTPQPHDAGERLQKVLAAAGLGSRRHCEEYILAGRVTIDGEVASNLGVRVNPETQKIAVDGERVKIQSKKYYLLNKPTGCLCTNADPRGRMRVIDLLPPMETRLFSVGRLDENTEGLLLVTNDGELAHRLAHPRFQVERVYRVLVAGQPTQDVLNQLQQGMYFAEGKFRLRQARKLKTKGLSTLLEVVITEGQNREVRRMFARLGHKVMSLQRIQFGPLRLGELAPAEYRPLRPQEIDRLRELVAAGGAPKRKTRRPPPAGGRSPQRRERPPLRGERLQEEGRPLRDGGPRPVGRPAIKRVRTGPSRFEEARSEGPRGSGPRPDRPRSPTGRPQGFKKFAKKGARKKRRKHNPTIACPACHAPWPSSSPSATAWPSSAPASCTRSPSRRASSSFNRSSSAADRPLASP
ncbi:MAG: hypothetical protein B7Z55_11030, partial [Planctomycetales bacterium 12-60-4]